VVEIEDFYFATSQLAQTTLRSVIGQSELDDLLAERDRINQSSATSSTSAPSRGASRSRPSRSRTSTCRRR
jgi:regulator of protease activity HflC (stomatin/prohibitin superfamily)